MSEFNPYQPTTNAPYERVIPPPAGFNPIREFDFMRLLRAPFVSPNWIYNALWMLLLGFLAIFIIGGIVFLGYAAEVVRARSGGRDNYWPDFKGDKFGDYLGKGIWAFLVQLVLTFAMFIVLGIPFLIGVSITAALASNNNGAIALICGLILAAIAIPVMFLAGMLQTSLTLKALFANDFMSCFDMDFVKSYFKRMIVPTILVFVFFAGVSICSSVLNMVTFGLAFIAITPFIYLWTCDVFAQLNDIHISRGGPCAFPLNDEGQI